ncbi:keratin, type I cuticular Ha4-like [Pelodytes ibericus]
MTRSPANHLSYTPVMGAHHAGSLHPKVASHISTVHHESTHKAHHMRSCISQHGGQYKAPTGHRISKKVSFSRHPSIRYGNESRFAHVCHTYHHKDAREHSDWNNQGFLSINEKETMQFLNERLAAYLEKVYSLEQKNAELEKKLCEWQSNNSPSSLTDSNQYFKTIQELQSESTSIVQIQSSSQTERKSGTSLSASFSNKCFQGRQTANMMPADYHENMRSVENSKQSALCLIEVHGCEIEVTLKNNIEADIGAFSGGLGEINKDRQNLEIHIICCHEELLQIKRNHEEEVNALHSQLGARVTVEMKAIPALDLNKALSQIREQYENLMERNLKEIDGMFLQKTAELGCRLSSGADQVQSVNNEAINLKCSIQTLEIELQSELSMESAMEDTLVEIEATYTSQLSQLQCLIHNIEAQLAKILCDLEQLKNQYRLVMEQKMHLEKEINTYKHLLDGHDIQCVKIPFHHMLETHEQFLKPLNM